MDRHREIPGRQTLGLSGNMQRSESQNTNNLDMRNSNGLCQFVKLHLFSTDITSVAWVKLEVALPSNSHFFSTLRQLVTALSLHKKHRAGYQYIDLIWTYFFSVLEVLKMYFELLNRQDQSTWQVLKGFTLLYYLLEKNKRKS